MHVARVVYEKYCNGDPIGDEELHEAIEFLTRMERDLRVMGPVFQLAANEAVRVLSSLESFARARSEKRKY